MKRSSVDSNETSTGMYSFCSDITSGLSELTAGYFFPNAILYVATNLVQY